MGSYLCTVAYVTEGGWREMARHCSSTRFWITATTTTHFSLVFCFLFFFPETATSHSTATSTLNWRKPALVITRPQRCLPLLLTPPFITWKHRAIMSHKRQTRKGLNRFKKKKKTRGDIVPAGEQICSHRNRDIIPVSTKGGKVSRKLCLWLVLLSQEKQPPCVAAPAAPPPPVRRKTRTGWRENGLLCIYRRRCVKTPLKVVHKHVLKRWKWRGESACAARRWELRQRVREKVKLR